VPFQANLLDDTTDEAGKVFSGSDIVSVMFEELMNGIRNVRDEGVYCIRFGGGVSGNRRDRGGASCRT
jgi:hypothetical protein